MVKKLKFLLNQTEIEANCEAHATVLDFLRSQGNTGTKEGCASGDCGACTVMVGDTDGYRTMNACIAPLGQIAGKHVVTVEGLAGSEGLHPAQQAMVDCHGSQCGFCTPGFVMSLAALVENDIPVDRDEVLQGISGNLCRCTGYRPIVEAGLQALSVTNAGKVASKSLPIAGEMLGYHKPQTEAELQADLLANPNARLVAGGTDLMLEVTQLYRDIDSLIDVSEVAELNQFNLTDAAIEIGAALSYSVLEHRLTEVLGESAEQTIALLHRLGSRQIRNGGTIGGNLANGSPIADMPPLLIVMDAAIELTNKNNERRTSSTEDFYTGYRQTTLAADEYISKVCLPRSCFEDFHRFYKSSKRIEDDISSVMGAFRYIGEANEIAEARVAFGGMAATPVRLTEVENLLQGAVTEELVRAAAELVAEAMQPLTDVRASASYRTAMAVSMLERSLREFNGDELPTVMEAI